MTTRARPRAIPAVDPFDRAVETARKLDEVDRVLDNYRQHAAAPTPRRRSPIEDAVDRACGITPADRARMDAESAQRARDAAAYGEFHKTVPGRKITIRCPSCGGEQKGAPMMVIDPPNTAVQIFPCGGPGCPNEGAEVVYLDAAGQRIAFP